MQNVSSIFQFVYSKLGVAWSCPASYIFHTLQVICTFWKLICKLLVVFWNRLLHIIWEGGCMKFTFSPILFFLYRVGNWFANITVLNFFKQKSSSEMSLYVQNIHEYFFKLFNHKNTVHSSNNIKMLTNITWF